MVTHINTGTSQLITYDGFLTPEFADSLMAHVLTLPLITEPKSVLYGKEVTFHRQIGYFSDIGKGYSYTGITSTKHPLDSTLKALLGLVNAAVQTQYNGVLVNVYRSGEDSIGQHADREIAPGESVTALSLGVSRKFRVKPKLPGGISVDVPTAHGQLLVMAGCFQQEFTHGIPVEKKVTGMRISLTFRRHREVPSQP